MLSSQLVSHSLHRLVEVFDVTRCLSLYTAFIIDSSVLGFCCEVTCILRYQASLYIIIYYNVNVNIVSSIMVFTTMLYLL